jgi:26S proteasome regulatory subunit N2
VSLLLAKIYFYLNEYDDALNFALSAGAHFDVNARHQSDFIEILINKAI